MSPAISLPSEILGEIVEYHYQSHVDLSNFCLVRKTWYPVAQAILYRSAGFKEHEAPRFFEVIDKYPHIYPLIRSLELQSLSTALLDVFQALRSYSNVSSLRLRSHRIDVEQRNILIRSFPQLEVLSLTNSTSHDGLSGLVDLICSFPKLRSLTLIDVSYRPNHSERTYPDTGIPISLRTFHCHLGFDVTDDLLGWMISLPSMPPISSLHLASYETYGELPNVVPSFLSSLPALKSAWVGVSTMWAPPSLTFAENSQLETIRLDLDLRGFNPSSWIPFLTTTLSSVSSALIQTIVITMWMSGGCAPHFDWPGLGSALRSPRFMNLRSVYITCNHSYVFEEPPYVGDLEDKIREALEHLVAKGIVTVV